MSIKLLIIHVQFLVGAQLVKKLLLMSIVIAVSACSSIPSEQGMGVLSASIGSKAGIKVTSSQIKIIDRIDQSLKLNIDEYHSELILPSKVPGLYQVYQSGGLFYTEETGSFLIMGNIYDVKNQRNTSDDALELSSVASAMADIKQTEDKVDGDAQDRPLEEPPEIIENPAIGAPKKTIELPAKDGWSGGFLVPDNLRGGEESISKSAADYGVKTFSNYAKHHALGGEAAFTQILRAFLVNEIPQELISATYPSRGTEKTSITVFTDPSCPNCQSFHSFVPELNERGVSVRYVLVPRNPSKQNDVVKAINAVYCQKSATLRLAAVEGLYSQSRAPDPGACSVDMLEKLQEAIAFYGVTKTPQIFVKGNGVVYMGSVNSERIMSDLEL